MTTDTFVVLVFLLGLWLRIRSLRGNRQGRRRLWLILLTTGLLCSAGCVRGYRANGRFIKPGECTTIPTVWTYADGSKRADTLTVCYPKE